MRDPLSPEGYAATGGRCCPVCGGRDLAWQHVSYLPAETVTRRVRCEDCSASWQAVYELVGYEQLSHGEDTRDA